MLLKSVNNLYNTDFVPGNYLKVKMLRDILLNKGYSIRGKFQGHNPDYKPVYLICDSNGEEYFAKYFESEGISEEYSWSEYKDIYNKMYELGFAPAIKEIIDVNENSGIIINIKFGESYYRHLRTISYYSIIENRLRELHTNGYIHGDMNACNSLIDTNNNTVMFIDFNQCFHKSDPRLLTHIKRIYNVDSFENACKLEIEDINFVPN